MLLGGGVTGLSLLGTKVSKQGEEIKKLEDKNKELESESREQDVEFDDASKERFVLRSQLQNTNREVNNLKEGSAYKPLKDKLEKLENTLEGILSTEELKAVTEVKDGLGKLVEELNVVHEKLDNSEEKSDFIFSELERLTDEVDKSKINFQELKNFCFLENTEETESIKKAAPKEVNVVQINCPFIESLGEISTLEYTVK